MIERRFTTGHVGSVRGYAIPGLRENQIGGLSIVFYDGTPGTQFVLAPGIVERIHRTALDRALAENQDVRALFNHDPSQLLGRTASGTLRLRKVRDGLQYIVDLPALPIGKQVLEYVRRGDVSGNSFAFTVRSERWRREGGLEVREVTDLDLFDVGPVTYPAYRATTVVAGHDARTHSMLANWDTYRARAVVASLR